MTARAAVTGTYQIDESWDSGRVAQVDDTRKFDMTRRFGFRMRDLIGRWGTRIILALRVRDRCRRCQSNCQCRHN